MLISRDYRIYELNDTQFEELCSKICIQVLGEGFVNFAKGRDGGKDGKFEGVANSLPSISEPYRGKFVVQAKHTQNSNSSCSDSQFITIVKKEIPRIAKLKTNGELDHYFILTNRKLTGEQEPKICKIINNKIPDINSITIWGKDRLHTFISDNLKLYKDFGFDKPRTPLRIYPNDLSKLIKEFRELLPKQQLKKDLKSDFLYVDIDKKNEINNLSESYYNYIKEMSEKHFKTINEFLVDPKHEEIKGWYMDTADDFRGLIISRRRDFNFFDEIIEELYVECVNKIEDSGINKKLFKVFIHFMYFNCDIGEKIKGKSI